MRAVRVFVRSISHAARGGATPRHAAIAVVLGCAAGAVCGWNFTFAALVAAACLLNAPWRLTLISAVAGQVLALAIAPVAHRLGMLLLDRCGLGELIGACCPGPVGAMFALDDYQLLGSLVAALAAAIVPARTAARRAAQTKSDGNKPDSLLRPWGRTAAAGCAVIVGMTTHTVGSQRAAQALLEKLGPALHVRANADKLDYNIWTGRLVAENLRLADLDRPEHTVLVVERLHAKVDPGLLLRGRLHADEISLRGLFCDSSAMRTASQAAIFEERPTLLREDAPTLVGGDDPDREVQIQNCLREYSGLKTRLAVIGKVIELTERVGELEVGGAAECSSDRSPPRDVATGLPATVVQIKRIKVDGLPAEWRIGSGTTIELADLSSRPATATRPTQLVCGDLQQATRLTVTMQSTSPERCHDVALTVGEAAVDSLLTLSTAHKLSGVARGGQAALHGKGRATRDRFELDLNVQLSDVTVAASAERFAGLPCDLWRQSLERLGGIQFQARVDGTWSQPKLVVRPGDVVRQMAGRLRSVGATEVAQVVEANCLRPTNLLASQSAVGSAYPTTKAPAASPLSLDPAANKPDAAEPAQANRPAKLEPNSAATIANTATAATPTPEVAAKPTTSPPQGPETISPTKVFPVAADNESPTPTESASTTPTLPPAPVVVARQEPAAAAKPTPAVPQPQLPAANSQTANNAPTPRTPAAPPAARKPEPRPTMSPAEAAAGLRQPRSVVEPFAAPGAVNLTTGYSSPEAEQFDNVARLPQPSPQVRPVPEIPPADDEPTTPTGRPRATFFGRSLLDPTDLPEEADVPEQAEITPPATPLPSEGDEPAKKPLFGNVKEFAGRLVGNEELPELDASQPPPAIEPEQPEAPTKKKALFPKLRSLIVPTDDADEAATQAPADAFPDRVATGRMESNPKAVRANEAAQVIVEDVVAVPQADDGARQALYAAPQRPTPRNGLPVAEAPGEYRGDTSPAKIAPAAERSSAAGSFYRRLVR